MDLQERIDKALKEMRKILKPTDDELLKEMGNEFEEYIAGIFASQKKHFDIEPVAQT